MDRCTHHAVCCFKMFCFVRRVLLPLSLVYHRLPSPTATTSAASTTTSTTTSTPTSEAAAERGSRIDGHGALPTRTTRR